MLHDALRDCLTTYLLEKLPGATRRVLNWERQRLVAFEKYLGRPATIADLSADSILEYQKSLNCRGLSRETIRNRVYYLRTFWRWLYAKGATNQEPPAKGWWIRGKVIGWFRDAPTLPRFISGDDPAQAAFTRSTSAGVPPAPVKAALLIPKGRKKGQTIIGLKHLDRPQERGSRVDSGPSRAKGRLRRGRGWRA